jgi:hypothetical protein
LNTSKGQPVIGEKVAEEGSFLGRLWAKQHGNQYAITAIASASSAVFLLLCGYQVLFLQNHVTWGAYTGPALVGAVFALAILLFSFPEYLRFKGHVLTLEEIKELRSTAELRRQKADGDLAAQALGAGHLEQWQAFLDSRGIRR